jgi:hypothetical protein
MKKAISVFLLLIVISLVLASCKTHELCPAYMKNNTKTVEKRG